ncbi:MAG: hypothetical protein GY757_23210 [bacterium]|nr:hypothetical protein [bacterium]
MPFRLDEIPLCRTQLLKLEDTMYHLVFNMHHVITDGWSIGRIKVTILGGKIVKLEKM